MNLKIKENTRLQILKVFSILKVFFSVLICVNCVKINNPSLETSINSGSDQILFQMIDVAKNEDISNYGTVSQLMGVDRLTIIDALRERGYYEKSLPLAYIYYREVNNNNVKKFILSVADLNRSQQCVPINLILKNIENDFTISPYRESPSGPTYILLKNSKVSVTFTDLDNPNATCASAIYITQLNTKK